MNKKIEDLTNLNYRLMSFMQTMLNQEGTREKHGKFIYLQSLFQKEFDDIIHETYTRAENNTEILDIVIPESETGPLNMVNSEGIFTDEMMGGDKKLVSKSVKIDTNKDEIYEIKKIPKKKDTKKAKIERRLNRLKADEVKKIGKKFNIKPNKEKKYLTKTDVIDNIKVRTGLYNKVLEHVDDNYNNIITETS